MQDTLQDWQQALKNAITDPQILCQELAIDPQILTGLSNITSFPLRVPRGYIARMEKGNPCDPLLLQILPLAKELITVPGYDHDPLLEQQSTPIPGLLHKYHGRVLLIVNGTCAVHCRYCFRRNFPYQQHARSVQEWQPALDYIAADDSIFEVILSGGDPLMLKDTVLNQLIHQISKIPHVNILRFHTRLPVVLPERITETLVKNIVSTRLQTVIVIHANHPNELDAHLIQHLLTLRQAGITLLNQSVLLRGVNDQAEILIRLSQQLFAAGVLPYYLHLLDPVHGTAHFSVPLAEAQSLLKAITNRLPGYLVPKLVQEVAGEAAKVAIA